MTLWAILRSAPCVRGWRVKKRCGHVPIVSSRSSRTGGHCWPAGGRPPGPGAPVAPPSHATPERIAELRLVAYDRIVWLIRGSSQKRTAAHIERRGRVGAPTAAC
jgi:hypothetical protein